MKVESTKAQIKNVSPNFGNAMLPAVPFKHLGLFEGIGGFSLAARWMGWETLAWCEWNEFGQKVLRYHFPEAEGHGDITKTDFKKYANRIDILTGGFPCQPYSQAGKRLGTEDDRHLWPEMLRVIGEVQPPYVVGENVYGITNWNGGLVFNEVQVDLESKGYEVQTCVLPACAVGALHRRDRVWFIAYSKHNRLRRWEQQQESQQTENGTTTNTINQRLQESRSIFRQEYELFINASDDASRGVTSQWSKAKRGSGNVSKDDGLPKTMDGITVSQWKQQSIKAFGNAIVPQVAYEIFKSVESVHWHSR
jgi:DNA (cytosine-5)-methyltransferase 1